MKRVELENESQNLAGRLHSILWDMEKAQLDLNTIEWLWDKLADTFFTTHADKDYLE